MVAEVLPRRSELSDPAIANVDHIVLVFAAADPPFDPPNVTRFLVTAEQARPHLPAVSDGNRVVTEVFIPQRDQCTSRCLTPHCSTDHDMLQLATQQHDHPSPITHKRVSLLRLLLCHAATLLGPSVSEYPDF
jgi:hypothetical protein